ncbi:hypothetical protein RB195_004934 [Necator americanus]|uniref:Uncharacterized protein n=1 Tax=Necator americanus TaxID=51031 RepID=A0ABR1BKE3_NECAM
MPCTNSCTLSTAHITMHSFGRLWMLPRLWWYRYWSTNFERLMYIMLQRHSFDTQFFCELRYNRMDSSITVFPHVYAVDQACAGYRTQWVMMREKIQENHTFSRRMNSKSLLAALKSGDSDRAKTLLKSVHASQWPSEILLPFALREVLRGHAIVNELSYVAKCFRFFSRFHRLHELQRNDVAELHRLALLAEVVHTMMSSGCDDIDKLSDFVMRRHQEIVCLYGSRRYNRQFQYLIAVCHRRTRLLDFKKRSRTLLVNILSKLQKRGLNFVESLITVMIR